MFVSAPNVFNTQNPLRPSFGSVVLSRVVLRTVEKNGDVFYSALANNEKGLVGVYQSLSRNIQRDKFSKIRQKLGTVIKDLNSNHPTVSSTLVGVRSNFKRYLLTGMDAGMARDFGRDFVGVMNNRIAYSDVIKKLILNDYKKRIFNQKGEEIALDLIVEGRRGKRKLVDVEISTLEEISKAKPPLIKSKIVQPEVSVPKEPKLLPKQEEFGFVNDLEEKKFNRFDYD